MNNEKEQTPAKEGRGLGVMRLPFPQNYISKLPKGTKAQNECQASEKVNCKVCGGWHHPRIVHLDYVGHAAITQRLLDADPGWYWEPMSFDQTGLPLFDDNGGLWIRLTVAGQTRIGYGDAAGKHGHNATKEAIGDALRNASMRFGAALELWHKGDWEINTLPDAPGEPENGKPDVTPPARAELPACPGDKIDRWIGNVKAGKAVADELLAFACGRYTLTDEQTARIKEFVMDVKNPPVDAKFKEVKEEVQP